MNYSTENEKAIISCCIKKPNLILAIKNVLPPESFNNLELGAIWNCLVSYYDKASGVDSSMMIAGIASESNKKNLYGIIKQETLTSITMMDVTPENINTYLKPVRNSYQIRQTKSLNTELTYLLGSGECSLNSIKKIIKKFSNIETSEDVNEPQSLVNIIDSDIATKIDAINSPDVKRKYWNLGYPSLEKYLRLLPKNIYCIAGRPGSGKSTFMRAIAYQQAYKKKYKILIFSLEMSKDELLACFACARCGMTFDTYSLMAENLQIKILEEFKTHLVRNKIEIIIDDTAMEINDIVAKTTRLHREIGLDVVYIDYLQLMFLDTMRVEEGVNENLLITSLLKILKKLSKDLARPIVFLSQLSRKVEEREDKHPMLSDLRSSGSIEQDSTAVLFLYRDEYYYPKNTKKKGIAEITFGKNRMGKSNASIELMFNGEYGRFNEKT